jgi:predicted DNA-binding mobile mystery protein A
MKIFEKLAITQLDKSLKPFFMLLNHQPKEGWIRTIRQTLHMSTHAFAKRLKVTQSTIVDLERREAEKGVTLKKMEEAAEAFGCRFVYAFVPKESFALMIHEQEKQKAEHLVQQIQKTMSLEEQALSPDQMKQQIELVQQHIKNEPLKNLWKNDEV